MPDQSEAACDVDSLRARFKARCLETRNVHQNWQIRVHRALSWLQRSTAFDDEHAEARFLYLWIAFNSLYSRWDPERNAPAADAPARRQFVRRLLELDSGGAVARLLHDHRGLVKKLLGNPYLSEVFWRNPDDPKARGHATEDANYIDRNLKNRDYARLLGQVMDRLYVFRGQLVHGASSGGSRLNRTTLNYCLKTMEQFLPTILSVTIDRGCGDDWPELCYPPVA